MKYGLVEKKVPVLLVDDRIENLTALSGILDDMGLEIDTADSGNEALRLTLKTDYALVLLDVQMPDMNGFETAELMRANPKTRHLPIIFVTAGMDDLQYQFKGYDAGAVDYLAKPIEPVIIRGKVKVFCEMYLQRKEIEMHRQQLEVLVEQRTFQLRLMANDLEKRVQERTNDLETAIQELDSFSYSVSHDLRAPLRHINSYASLLLEECTRKCQGGESLEFLKRLVSASRKMDQLIDGLLNLSRMSKNPLKIMEVNLSRVADEVVEALRLQEPERKVICTIEPMVTARADLVLIRAALENLIGNAWKYSSKKDDAQIEFGTVPDGVGPTFFVRDNGAGFDMKYADKLFGEFQRLHKEQDFKGIGIGLATVKRIIRRHGGTVWGEGVPGKGATFYFTLP